MAKKKIEHKLSYLRANYSKHYKKGDLEKAKRYSNVAINKHGVDLDIEYHAKLEKRQGMSMFGFSKPKRIKYG